VQGELEEGTRSRIADAARAIEELRSQLNEEQVLRRGEDGHHARLAAAAHDLDQQVHTLHSKLQDRDAALADARQEAAQAAEQLAGLRQSSASEQAR
jgi:hypothetical protein